MSNDPKSYKQHTYEDAGFNRYFERKTSEEEAGDLKLTIALMQEQRATNERPPERLDNHLANNLDPTIIQDYNSVPQKDKDCLLNNTQEKTNNDGKPYLWVRENNKATLCMHSESPMIFRGSYCAGIDLLINSIDHDFSTQELQSVISQYKQGKGKSPKQISVTKWRNQLFSDRKDFAKYFDIVFAKPNHHRLIFKPSNKSR